MGCHCLEIYKKKKKKKTDPFSSKPSCAAAEQFSVFLFVYSTVFLVEKKSSNGAIQVISNTENNPETLTKVEMDINICGLCAILGWKEQDTVSMGSRVEAPVAPGPGQPFILYIL